MVNRKITKRESESYAWATIICSIASKIEPNQRENYIRNFVSELKNYKFYSRKKEDEPHSRAVTSNTPKLISYNIDDTKSFGKFVGRALESGLVADSSKKKREWLIKYLEEMISIK